MFSGVQAFVDFLEKHEKIIRVDRRTSTNCEISEQTSQFCQSDNSDKAILFSNCDKKLSILTNYLNSETSLGFFFDAPSLEKIKETVKSYFNEIILDEHSSIMDILKCKRDFGTKLKYAPKKFHGTAPCQESVQYTVKLKDLPFLKHSQDEPEASYPDAVVISCDPETGKRYIENFPIQIIANSTVIIAADEKSNLAKNIAKCICDLPVMICLGGNPMVNIMSKVKCDIDKLSFIGFIQQSPIAVVNGFTQNIFIPAETDIVIEGVIHKSDERKSAEIYMSNGFTETVNNCPVFKASCISHRSDAILPEICSNKPWKALEIINRFKEFFFTEYFRKTISTDINDISIPFACCGNDIIFVSLNKNHLHESKQVIAQKIWSSDEFYNNKVIVFTNSDIDIHNIKSIQECLVSNVFPSKNIYITSPLQNSTSKSISKMMIDATSQSELILLSFKDIFDFSFDPEVEDSDLYAKIIAVSRYVDIKTDCKIAKEQIHINARK